MNFLVKPATVMLILLAAVPLLRAQPTLPPIVMPPGNIVANGGFESRFAGWRGRYGYVEAITIGRPIPALEGKIAGVVVDVFGGSVYEPMWQILPTTIGTTYDFRFSLLSGYGLVGEQSLGNAPAPVTVYWGGELFGSGSQLLGVFRNSSTTTWQTYSFEVTATSSSTIIQFVNLNDARWQLIDAVSVVAVPEPTDAALVLTMLIVPGYFYRANLPPLRRGAVSQSRH